MKKESGIAFLYRTTAGRALLKLLVQPEVSRLTGRFLNSGLSKPLIKPFIRRHNIDMWDVLVPEHGFSSFNDFFKRKRTDEAHTKKSGELISPCDGYLSCMKIQEDLIYDIKHTIFRTEELLKNRTLAREFEGGYAFVFRLTPANYHRYWYAAGGMVLDKRTIPGVLHCVRPIATGTLPVYAQNAREYVVIQSAKFGKIVQMEIGALLVGKIANHPVHVGKRVFAETEKGYFEFGGSTIVLLVKKGQVTPCEKVLGAKGGEIAVYQGMVIAKSEKNCKN